MRASRFSGLGIFRLSSLIAITALLSPLACPAQTETNGDASGSAWGRVLFATDDRPVHDARVQFARSSPLVSNSVITDADGNFAIEGLIAATYDVTVTAPGCDQLEAKAEVRGTTGPLVFRLSKTQIPAGPGNDFVVSVQELQMSRKGQKAFVQGTQLLLRGKSAGSLEYLARAIAENPGHYRAYHNLGLAYFRLGRITEAEEAFHKSIELSGGGFALPQIALGAVLWQRQEFRQAEIIIQKSLEVDPDSASGRYFLGLAQLGLGRLAEAAGSIREALARRANFAEAYFALSTIHHLQHDPHAEVEDLQNYLTLAPRSALSDKARGLLEAAQRQIKESAPSSVTAGIHP